MIEHLRQRYQRLNKVVANMRRRGEIHSLRYHQLVKERDAVHRALIREEVRAIYGHLQPSIQYECRCPIPEDRNPPGKKPRVCAECGGILREVIQNEQKQKQRNLDDLLWILFILAFVFLLVLIID